MVEHHHNLAEVAETDLRTLYEMVQVKLVQVVVVLVGKHQQELEELEEAETHQLELQVLEQQTQALAVGLETQVATVALALSLYDMKSHRVHRRKIYGTFCKSNQ